MISQRTSLIYLAGTLVAMLWAAVLFTAYPRLDLVISATFGTDGNPFPIAATASGKATRSVMIALTDGTMLAVASFLILGLVSGIRIVRPRVLAFALGVYVLVPGLIVNGLFKSHWGRARPRHIVEFGGQAQFTPPLQIADQCDRHCSFVSGEASALFTVAVLLLLIFVPSLPSGRRRWVTAGILGIATLGSVLRVAFGGHFASDVIFAALLSTAITLVIYCLSGLHRLPGPLVPSAAPTRDGMTNDRARRQGPALR